MNKKAFLYPFLVLLLIFIVDKTVLLPIIYKYGRTEPSPLESIREGMKLIYQSKIKYSHNQSDAVFFGSSRTDGLRSLSTENIERSKFLSSGEKNQLLKFNFEMRGSAKASDLFYNFFLLKDILASNYKPSVIFFEISPEMFNRNSPYHASFHFQNNKFEYSELFSILKFAENDWKRKVLGSILFPSKHYNFSWSNYLKNSIRNIDYLYDNLGIQLIFSSNSVYSVNKFNDFSEDINTGIEFEKKIVGYSDYMEFDFILKDYQFSDSEFKIFQEIIQLAQNSDIPVVFWRPKLHSFYQDRIEKIGLNKVDQMIENQLLESELIYINLQKSNLKCNYFTDSSHLSGRCAPEVIFQLLKTYQESIDKPINP